MKRARTTEGTGVREQTSAVPQRRREARVAGATYDVHGHPRRWNLTLTKRVDHEGGREPRAEPGSAICLGCGATYAVRRWMEGVNGGERAALASRPWPRDTVCPACKQMQDGIPAGFVHLDGAFLSGHRDEIRRLLENEAARAAADNPLGRIMGWVEDEHGRVTVTTTTEHLAQRLGHALEKAMKGKVRYDFSHENKLARVHWHRD